MPDQAASRATLPSCVVQLGVYRSASTWAANAVAALLRPHGPVRILFDDVCDPASLPDDATERLVFKVHRPSDRLNDLIRRDAPPFVITIRDPLDCVASMMRQFDVPFDAARVSIAQSCQCVLGALAQRLAPRFVILRYEANPRDAAAIRALAALLGVGDADVDTIADALAPNRVNAYIDGLIADGTFGDTPTPAQSHPETHWHPRHLGSGAVGRYRDLLNADEIAAVRAATVPFRRAFGYGEHGE